MEILNEHSRGGGLEEDLIRILQEADAYAMLQILKSSEYNAELKLGWCRRKARKAVSKYLTDLCLIDEHYSSLRGSNWLNDQVINGYVLCQLLLSELDLTKISYTSTFFLDHLDKHGPKAASDMYIKRKDNPTNWDLFSLEICIIPIHATRNHWNLAFIDFKNEKVVLYDSMRNSQVQRKYLALIKQFLQYHHQEVVREPLASRWGFTVEHPVEQQLDGFNCGIYVCRFVELFVQSWKQQQCLPNASSCFSSRSDIHRMRKRVEESLRQQIKFEMEIQSLYVILAASKCKGAIFVLSIPRSLRRFRVLNGIISRIPTELWIRLRSFLETQ